MVNVIPVFNLPRLYHRPAAGQDNQTSPAGEMLAATPGLTRVHWDEARRLAPLPIPASQEYPQGALGLFRGQTVDFILAYTCVTAARQPLVHYVLLTTEALRQAAGRVRLLLPLAQVDALPDPAEKTLPPQRFTIDAPPTEAEQTGDLLALTLSVRDNFEAIEGMLAALVQGIPLGIVQGPRDLETQLAFLQGLLALLPVPARFGVTFATFVRRPEATPVQIAFLANDAPPEGRLIYDWQASRLIGQPPEDPYSRFIVSQLRLDATVAVQQMVALTRTAAWRLTRGEALADALGYAARRVALDAAVREGQPADSELAAAVLREDPTLSEDLRVFYVRHLLAFVLALEETEPADIVALLARGYLDVAEQTLAMLDDAIAEGKAYPAYRLLARWLANPLGPEGYNWRLRAHQAAAAHLQSLASSRNVPGMIAFLGEVQVAGPTLMIGEAAPRLLEIALPLANESPELARALFVLAAEYLPSAPFQRLLRMVDFVRQLPEPLQTALPHFQPGPPAPAPAGVLVRAAAAFGPDWELLVLARLVEWIVALNRSELIETGVLVRLAALARSERRQRFEVMLRQVVEDLGRPALLVQLEPPGPRLLVEILLMLGDYRQVIALMERVSANLFRGDAQVNFAPWVSEVFENTALQGVDLLNALDTVAELGLKSVPRAMAYRGALVNKAFDPSLKPLLDRLMVALSQDPRLIPLVGYDQALNVLRFYARQQEADSAVRLATSITDSLGGAEDGLNVVGRIWSLLNWNKDVRQAALEMLRRYARQASPEQAVRIPVRVGRKLGDRVQEMLQATVTLNIMTGGEGLLSYAHEVHLAAALLCDLAAAYEKTPYPTLKRLRSDLDALGGGLSEDERRQLSDDLLSIARSVFTLGADRSRGRGRANVEQRLLEGSEAPAAGVDALRWIGGYLAKGDAIPPNLEREAIRHVTGERSANMLYDEARVVRRLLERLLEAFPPTRPPTLTVEAFRAEVASLWESLRLYDQRQIINDFAADAQALATLIGLISDKGDERAVRDTSLGRDLETARREPRSALEVLRLFSGYFARKFAL